MRAFAPQHQNFADQRRILSPFCQRATRRKAAPEFFAQIPPGGESQERFGGRTRQGEDIAIKASRSRRFPRGLAGEIGQAIQIGIGQHHAPFILIGQHILPEAGVQRGKPGGDFRKPRARL